MRHPEVAPTGELLREPARAVIRRFVQRQDRYARQRDDGRYAAIQGPVDDRLVAAHLRGEVTLGVYVLDTEQRTRYVVLDADDDAGWRGLLAAAQDLARQGVSAYCETSRRGGHLWFFFAEPLPGSDARHFGQGLLHHYDLPGLELFPKQARAEQGPGSLIRLPFGIHRKSGRRYGFVMPDGRPLAATVRAQIRCLDAAQTVPMRLFTYFASLAPPPPSRADFVGIEDPTATLSARIKAAVRVRDFIAQYVELSPAGLGLCPFHDDHSPSLSVNAEENYWHCFACGVGGSVIDFWMRYRRCSFRDAVRELAEMVLPP